MSQFVISKLKNSAVVRPNEHSSGKRREVRSIGAAFFLGFFKMPDRHLKPLSAVLGENPRQLAPPPGELDVPNWNIKFANSCRVG